MSLLPFQPGTRVKRELILVGADHSVNVLDETSEEFFGTLANGIWRSQSLCRQDDNRLFTLTLLSFSYTASGSSSITVKVSGDGGATWAYTKVVPILSTVESQMRHAFLAPIVTGFDIRFQFELDQPGLVNIFRGRAKLVSRGEANYG